MDVVYRGTKGDAEAVIKPDGAFSNVHLSLSQAEAIVAKLREISGKNQINVIKPYLWEGMWVFDDPAVGLYKEPLIAGMPELIVEGCKLVGIESPENGFVAVFSGEPFQDAKIVLDWLFKDGGGNTYECKQLGGRCGWLCPALMRYFSEVPKKIYIDLKPAK